MKTLQSETDKKHIPSSGHKREESPSHNVISVLNYMFYQITCYMLNSEWLIMCCEIIPITALKNFGAWLHASLQEINETLL